MFLTLALQRMSQNVTPQQGCRIETQPYLSNQMSRRGVEADFITASRFSGPDAIFSGSHAFRIRIF